MTRKPRKPRKPGIRGVEADKPYRPLLADEYDEHIEVLHGSDIEDFGFIEDIKEIVYGEVEETARNRLTLWDRIFLEEYISKIWSKTREALEFIPVVVMSGLVDTYFTEMLKTYLSEHNIPFNYESIYGLSMGGAPSFVKPGFTTASTLEYVMPSIKYRGGINIIEIFNTAPLDIFSIVNEALKKNAKTIIIVNKYVSSTPLTVINVHPLSIDIYYKYGEELLSRRKDLSEEEVQEFMKKMYRILKGLTFRYVKGVMDYVEKHILSPSQATIKDIEKAISLQNEVIKSWKKPPFSFLHLIESDKTLEDYGNEKIAKIILEQVVIPLNYWLKDPSKPPNIPPILMMGSPGTGKTYLITTLAGDPRNPALVYQLDTGSIKSKWYGETENNLRAVFQYAKSVAPAIIFIDEIDTILPKRGGTGLHETTSSMLGIVLQWMEEGIKYGVVLVGATNKPEAIDEAILNRFQLRIPILAPKNPVDVEKIYMINVKHHILKYGIEYSVDKYYEHELINRFIKQRYVPRDIRNLLLIAKRIAVARAYTTNKHPPVVDEEVLEEALKMFKPIGKAGEIERIENASKRYSSIPVEYIYEEY